MLTSSSVTVLQERGGERGRDNMRVDLDTIDVVYYYWSIDDKREIGMV
jgi:hypothetical protein